MLFCAPVASDAEYSLPALLNALVPVLIVLLCCCLSLLCAVVLVLSYICIPMIAPDIPSLPTRFGEIVLKDKREVCLYDETTFNP